MRVLLPLILLLALACEPSPEQSERPSFLTTPCEDFAPGDTLPQRCQKRGDDPVIGPEVPNTP